jgi:hypothetical protein
MESVKRDILRSHFDMGEPVTKSENRGINALFSGTKKVKDPESI